MSDEKKINIHNRAIKNQKFWNHKTIFVVNKCHNCTLFQSKSGHLNAWPEMNLLQNWTKKWQGTFVWQWMFFFQNIWTQWPLWRMCVNDVVLNQFLIIDFSAKWFYSDLWNLPLCSDKCTFWANAVEQILHLTTYAGKKVTIGAGHFQIIDFFYDW